MVNICTRNNIATFTKLGMRDGAGMLIIIVLSAYHKLTI